LKSHLNLINTWQGSTIGTAIAIYGERTTLSLNSSSLNFPRVGNEKEAHDEKKKEE
jgi:hypothetical protein